MTILGDKHYNHFEGQAIWSFWGTDNMTILRGKHLTILRDKQYGHLRDRHSHFERQLILTIFEERQSS